MGLFTRDRVNRVSRPGPLARAGLARGPSVPTWDRRGPSGQVPRSTVGRAKAAAYGAPRPIVASAERIKLDQTVYDRPYSEWQAAAWSAYEAVGEVHYGFGFVASVMSRIRLFPAVVVGPNEAPVETGRATGEEEAGGSLIDPKLAADAEAVFNELGDKPGLVRSFTLNTLVAGEVLLCQLPTGEPAKPGEEPTKKWSFRSTDEVQVRVGGAVLTPMRGQAAQVNLPPDTYIARVWKQHPRWSAQPDSSMLAVADTIEELLMLQRLVRSATRSRLNAGLLFIPDGITASSATVTADPPDEPLGDDGLPESAVADPGGTFLAELMDSMVTPISDEGSASAVVPMLTTGPGELGNQIVHKTFERSSDQWLVDRTERALERILQGLDVPKEIVSGLKDVKFANALVIDENLYKASIEPLALMLADALTTVFLRPLLRAMGHAEEALANVVCWYDPSDIVTKPNAADDASNGYDRFLLGPDAWRREHGFPETDAPSEEELAFMLLTQKGQLPEDVTASLLNVLLPEVLGAQRAANQESNPAPVPESAERLLKAVPSGTQAPPAQPAAPVGNATQNVPTAAEA